MFFQNVFDSSFTGSMIYSDRQYNISWVIPGNVNRSDLTICWVKGPYNLIGNNIFTINFSILIGDTAQAQKYYSAIQVTLPSSTSVLSSDVVTALNNNAQFANWFTAYNYCNFSQVMIQSNPGRLGLRFYISNTGAETIMQFNQKAPVRELPSYYLRETIDNAPFFPNSAGQLIHLDPTHPVDAQIIRNAGFDPTNELPDWALLTGRAEDFKFELNYYDGSGRIIETLEFFAGATVGDMSRKTLYTYSGSSTFPSASYQIPHVLNYVDVSSAIPPVSS